MARRVFGGIEAGGTKFVCGVGSGPDDLTAVQIPTTTPAATLHDAIQFFRGETHGKLEAIGIGSFGPIDLNKRSATYGCITSTPKPGWRDCDIVGVIREDLHVPVAFDTDVNAAALAEGRWGAAQGLSDFLYLTVGTGIGGGAVVNQQLVHGMVHTEMGHIPIPHDLARDPYSGFCPYHGDCLEGLAAGPAMHARWGKPADALPANHPAWELEAYYLALALAVWVCSLSPQRIVMGGGVMQQPHLFPLIRVEIARILNGYVRVPEITERLDEYVTPAQLGGRAGILGTFLLAEQAYT